MKFFLHTFQMILRIKNPLKKSNKLCLKKVIIKIVFGKKKISFFVILLKHIQKKFSLNNSKVEKIGIKDA